MTALPDPGRLLTIREYAALPEDPQHHVELQEGVLVMSPAARHRRATMRLAAQLQAQLPDGLELIPDVDIDLALTPEDQPGHARRPDLILVGTDTVDRAEAEGRLIRAAEVHLVVEIVAPGSRRMDHVIKRGEYSDAGIGHYWIIDLDPPVTLLACHPAGDLGYADDGASTGIHHATDPITAVIDLPALR